MDKNFILKKSNLSHLFTFTFLKVKIKINLLSFTLSYTFNYIDINYHIWGYRGGGIIYLPVRHTFISSSF